MTTQPTVLHLFPDRDFRCCFGSVVACADTRTARSQLPLARIGILRPGHRHYNTFEKETCPTRFASGCSIRAAYGNSISLPLGPTQVGPWMRWVVPAHGLTQPWGEEFAPDKSASATTRAEPLTNHRERYLAKECVGSNRALKRTIATSCSDDSQGESNQSRPNRNEQQIIDERQNRRLRRALPLRSAPDGNRTPLDRLFQERFDTRFTRRRRLEHPERPPASQGAHPRTRRETIQNG
jgi:hypothetical protein